MVSVERYLHRTRRHISKVFEEMVGRGESWKVQLNIVISFMDGIDETIKPIWSTLHVIKGSDMEEVRCMCAFATAVRENIEYDGG